MFDVIISWIALYLLVNSQYLHLITDTTIKGRDGDLYTNEGKATAILMKRWSGGRPQEELGGILGNEGHEDSKGWSNSFSFEAKRARC
jgi:hypothetical protein